MNKINTFTQKIHTESGIILKHFIAIEDFVNVYLKDEIIKLQKNTDDKFIAQACALERVKSDLEEVNDRLDKEVN